MTNNYIPVTLTNANVGGAANYQSVTISLPSGYLSEISLASIGGSSSTPSDGFLTQAYIDENPGDRMLFTSGDYAASVPGIRTYGGEELVVGTHFATGCQVTSVRILVVVSTDAPAGSYLTQDYGRSYPRMISLPAPAAGSEYADVVIDGARDALFRILSVVAPLHTGTGSPRALQVNDMPFRTYSGSYTIGASSGATFLSPAAPILPARTVTFNTTNLGASDQYDAGKLYVEEIWRP